MFLHRGTVISWKSVKLTLIAISTNHSEIIALYEALRECVWLRIVINHIETLCGIGALESPTIIYEDNAACVAQIQIGYIKTNYTKHISPNFTHVSSKSMGKLASCKPNLMIILQICL
jgi:hypothetical protein